MVGQVLVQGPQLKRSTKRTVCSSAVMRLVLEIIYIYIYLCCIVLEQKHFDFKLIQHGEPDNR